ncbi:hypothetical protein MJ1_0524 [Nanobdella aerobiophila]|uniref:Uncharacterized protein n=1 Tax=Nanobdella aerobiophila TaxID=2586965 RepID=A0A915SIJ2_9ARCH|nr:hypothetical protein [Nanobdella aerobiophila]BBL45677.1 hypothetical protein MJ1_0524 [Nanobdella aerobiophila]
MVLDFLKRNKNQDDMDDMQAGYDFPPQQNFPGNMMNNGFMNSQPIPPQQNFPQFDSGQINPQSFMPNLPPQMQNDITGVVQSLNAKLDTISSKLDNIIMLLNNMLQYYQYMFRR